MFLHKDSCTWCIVSVTHTSLLTADTTPGAPFVLPKCWRMCFPAQQVGCDHREPRVAADWSLPPSAASLAVWLWPAPTPASPLSSSQADRGPARQPSASCVERASSVEDHTHIQARGCLMIPSAHARQTSPGKSSHTKNSSAAHTDAQFKQEEKLFYTKCLMTCEICQDSFLTGTLWSSHTNTAQEENCPMCKHRVLASQVETSKSRWIKPVQQESYCCFLISSQWQSSTFSYFYQNLWCNTCNTVSFCYKVTAAQQL